MTKEHNNITCTLCASSNVKLFHDTVSHMPDSRAYQCQACGITFIYPLLSEQEEKELYQNYNSYVEKRWGLVSQDAAQFHDMCMPTVRRRYETIKHIVADARSVLEIGSSTGAFLSLVPAEKRYGVEAADENREYSKQCATDVYADIKDVPDTLTCDVVCMFHVLEHIRNPIAFLQQCVTHLAPEGMCIIEVPHIEDPLISLYASKEYKDFYFQPIHPFVYSDASLKYVIERAGLREQQVMYYQRYGLANHLAWLTHGTPGGDPVFDQLFGDDMLYMQRLSDAKKTDTLIYCAKRTA